MLNLRVRFDKPGFFLNDPRLVVRIDDRKLYDGSFTEGFDVSLSLVPGRHVLETAIYGPFGAARVQQIELPLDADSGYRGVPAVEAKLRYSRITGNFKRRADVSVKR